MATYNYIWSHYQHMSPMHFLVNEQMQIYHCGGFPYIPVDKVPNTMENGPKLKCFQRSAAMVITTRYIHHNIIHIHNNVLWD